MSVDEFLRTYLQQVWNGATPAAIEWLVNANLSIARELGTQLHAADENVQNHVLRAKWTFAIAAPASNAIAGELEDEITAAFIREVVDEIKSDLFLRDGKLVAIFATGVTIDPVTFEPVMRFSMRYNP